MTKRLRSIDVFGLLFSALLTSLAFPLALSAEADRLGRIRFSTSATAAAQEHFIAGLAFLHSFGFKQARSEFIRTQTLDPDFALGYWGEALTYNHPLYPEIDSNGPSQALLKLGSSRDARLTSAPPGIERGLLRALDGYVFSEGTLLERRVSYRAAMESLYSNFPVHEEALSLYILSLLSEAASSGQEQRQQLRELAGLLSSRLFTKNDQHPGAAHYLIHAYDDPEHAELALEAADRYAEIAPLVAHARHMPSHIYGLLGRWYDVADLNETAFYTARALWRPGDSPDDQVHALDFGQYGDLQLANFKAAEVWLERARDTVAQNPDYPRVTDLPGRMRARELIESKRWLYLPVDNGLTDEELFASGLSATNMRDLALAREALTLLEQRVSDDPDNAALRIAQLELEASILFASQRIPEGLAAIDQAVGLTLSSTRIDPLPDPIKPALELKGELLLRADRATEAIDAFQSALELTPHRPWSLLGLARSYVAAGMNDQASIYYRELLNHWSDPRLLGVGEARTHLDFSR